MRQEQLSDALRFDGLIMCYATLGIDRLQITFDKFTESMREWDVIPHYIGEELVCAVMQRGREFHMCHNGKRPKETVRYLRALRVKKVKELGMIYTQTFCGDISQDRLFFSVGFERMTPTLLMAKG